VHTDDGLEVIGAVKRSKDKVICCQSRGGVDEPDVDSSAVLRMQVPGIWWTFDPGYGFWRARQALELGTAKEDSGRMRSCVSCSVCAGWVGGGVARWSGEMRDWGRMTDGIGEPILTGGRKKKFGEGNRVGGERFGRSVGAT